MRVFTLKKTYSLQFLIEVTLFRYLCEEGAEIQAGKRHRDVDAG